MVQTVGQGRPYFFPYFFWSLCFCWYIHKHQTRVTISTFSPSSRYGVTPDWVTRRAHKARVSNSCRGNRGVPGVHRGAAALPIFCKKWLLSTQAGRLLCKAPHKGPAAGGQPSYRGSEKHSRMLCSMLTHSKRELNSLYNKIAEHSWSDWLILCRRCAVSTQGKGSEPVVSPLHCPALIIHTEIRNLKLDLEMWLTCWLVMALRPTVSTVPERLLKAITEPKDTDSYFSRVSVGIFKERSYLFFCAHLQKINKVTLSTNNNDVEDSFVDKSHMYM